MLRGISSERVSDPGHRKQGKLIDGDFQTTCGAAREIFNVQCPSSLQHRGSLEAQLHRHIISDSMQHLHGCGIPDLLIHNSFLQELSYGKAVNTIAFNVLCCLSTQRSELLFPQYVPVESVVRRPKASGDLLLFKGG